MRPDIWTLPSFHIAFATLAAAVPTAGMAQSFDCALAQTASEIAICQDPGLSRMDVELLAVYRAALAAGDPERVKSDGRRLWAVRRDCMGDPDCLEHAYREAIGYFSGAGQVVAMDPPSETDDIGEDDSQPVRSLVESQAPSPAAAVAVLPPGGSTCERDMAYFRGYLAHLETRPMAAGAVSGPATMVPEEELLNNSDLKAARRLEMIGVPRRPKGFGVDEAYCDAIAAAEATFGSTAFMVLSAGSAPKDPGGLRLERRPVQIGKQGQTAPAGFQAKQPDQFNTAGQSPVSRGWRNRIEFHPTDPRERERIDYRNIYAATIVSPWTNFPEPLPPLWVAFTLAENLDDPGSDRCTVKYARTPFSIDGRGAYKVTPNGVPPELAPGIEVMDLVGDHPFLSFTSEGGRQFYLGKQTISESAGADPSTDIEASHLRLDRFYDAFEETFDTAGFVKAFVESSNLTPVTTYPTPDRAVSEVVNSPACQAAMKAERSALVSAGDRAIAHRNGILGLTP